MGVYLHQVAEKALQPSKPAEQSNANTSTTTLTAPKSSSREPNVSLIRRRSLAIPGLATRNSRSDDRRKTMQVTSTQKGTEEGATEEPPWKIDMLYKDSPLANLGGKNKNEEQLEKPRNVFQKALPDTPRAQTPGDMEYSHLGNIKPGTLVIMNGTASPEPSGWTKRFPKRGSSPDTKTEEDYFTASEGQLSVNASDRSGDVSPVMPTENAASFKPHRTPREERGARQIRNFNKRESSPLKHQQAVDDIPDQEHLLPQAKSMPTKISQDASSYANDYLAEISFSPFVDQLESGTGADGEHEDDNSVSTPTESEKNYRDEALRMLDGTIFQRPLTIPRKPVGGNVKSPQQVATERPKQIKYDSGYSSAAPSLWNDTSSDYSREHGIERMTSRDLVQSPASSSYKFFASLSPNASADCPRPVAQRPPLRQTWSEQVPVTRIVLGQPGQTASSSPNATTAASNKEMRPTTLKKLQKNRPSSQQVIIQCHKPIDSGTIPSVPDHIYSNFARRLTMSPDMEHLNHTYPSASQTGIDDDLDSPPSPISPIRFPSPGKDTPQRPSTEEQQDAPPPPPPHRHPPNLFRRFSRTRSRSRSRATSMTRERDAVMSIADFGTVAHSLGSSPYDIATDTFYSNKYESLQSQFQGSISVPRAKSMVNMNSLARDAPRQDQYEYHDTSPNPQWGPQHLSYGHHGPSYDTHINEGMALRQHRSRPKSMYYDAPPVPDLPQNRPPINSRPSYGTTPNVRPEMESRRSYVDTTELQEQQRRQQPADCVPARAEWAASAKVWREHRKTVGNDLQQQQYRPPPFEASCPPGQPQQQRQQNQRFFLPANRARYHNGGMYPPQHQQQQYQQPRRDHRYAGGLDYAHSAPPPEGRFGMQWGLDLADVPVFVQRS